MTVELVLKVCTKCDAELPLSGFYRNRASPDGYGWWCKDCTKVSVYAAQQRLREEIGDGAFRSLKADAVRRHRQTSKGKEASRLQADAYHRAERQLREAHRDEFDALLRIARHELGLPT